MTKKLKWDFWTIITVFIIGLFLLFLIYPLLSLFLSGFKDSGTDAWNLENYTKFFSSKY